VYSGLCERYLYRSSLVHHLDPRLKLLATVAFVLAVTAIPHTAWYALLLLSALAGVVVLTSRVPCSHMMKRASIALPFAGMAAISLPFTRHGQALWTIRLLGQTLAVTDQGLWLFGSVIAKAWVSLLISGLLVATTPFSDLIQAMRKLRVPNVLVTIISFTYRYSFVLVAEALRMQTARDARSAGPGGTILWRVRVLGDMIGSLFIRSYERSERIYQAMLARGYRGQLLTTTELAWTVRDTWVAIVWGAALATILVLAFTMA